MIRAVLFDLGDTLLDRERVSFGNAFAQGARYAYSHLSDRGCSLPVFDFFYRNYLWAWRIAWVRSLFTGIDFNGADLIRRGLEKNQLPSDPALVHELAWLWYQPIAQRCHVEDGLVASLARMRKAGLKLGIVSNTFVPGAVIDRHLAQLKLLDLFPTRIYSSEFGPRKPDRRIFQAALDQLGLDAGDTIFVGDVSRIDIRGAARMGMRPVFRQRFGKMRPHRHAEFTVRRASDVAEIIDRIESRHEPVPAAEEEDLSDAPAGLTGH